MTEKWKPINEWHEEDGDCLFVAFRDGNYWGTEWTSPNTYDANGKSFNDKYADCNYIRFKKIDLSDFPFFEIGGILPCD